MLALAKTPQFSRALYTKSVGKITILLMLCEFLPKIIVKTEANLLLASNIKRKVRQMAKLVLNGSKILISTPKIK